MILSNHYCLTMCQVADVLKKQVDTIDINLCLAIVIAC